MLGWVVYLQPCSDVRIQDMLLWSVCHCLHFRIMSLNELNLLRTPSRYCMHAGYVRYGDVPSMMPAEVQAWAAACSSAPATAAPTSLGAQSGAGRHAAESAADAVGRRARRAAAAYPLIPNPAAAAAADFAASGCAGGGAGLLAGSGQGAWAGSGGRGAARPACSDSEATISGAPCRRGGAAGGRPAAQAAVDQASAFARQAQMALQQVLT